MWRNSALARTFSNRSMHSCYFFFRPSSSLDPTFHSTPTLPHPPPRGQMYFPLACLPSIQIRSEIAIAVKIYESSSTGQSQPRGHDRYDSSLLSPERRVSLPGRIGTLPDSKPHTFNHQTEFFIHSSILNSPLEWSNPWVLYSKDARGNFLRSVPNLQLQLWIPSQHQTQRATVPPGLS